MTTLEEANKRDTPQQNAFAGQKTRPTQNALASALASTLPLWNQLIADLTQQLNIDKAEWHSGSVKHGWSMRLQLKKRNIVYLGPRHGWFVAAFALGDKAVTAARRSALPPDVIQNIDKSKRYVEGTAVQIDIRSQLDLEIVKTLAKIKMDN